MKIKLDYPDRDGKGSYYIEAWARVCKNGKCYDGEVPGYYYIEKDKYYCMGGRGCGDIIVATNKADFLKYLKGRFKRLRILRLLLSYLNLRRLKLLRSIRRVLGMKYK